MQQNISLLKLLKISLSVFSQNFHIFLPIALLFYIPLNLAIDITLVRDIDTEQLNTIMDYINLFNDPMFLINNLISLFGFMLVLPVHNLVVLAVMKFLKKEKLIMQQLFNDAIKLWAPCLKSTIMAGIIIVIGFTLFIIPGIIASVFFTFVIPAIIIARQKNTAALRYSYNMVKGSFTMVFFYIMVMEILLFIISSSVLVFIPDYIGLTTLGLTITSIISIYAFVFNTLLFIDIERLRQ